MFSHGDVPFILPYSLRDVRDKIFVRIAILPSQDLDLIGGFRHQILDIVTVSGVLIARERVRYILWAQDQAEWIVQTAGRGPP